ncbi:UvrD-helicase domain-containing protein [Rossellomorea aquimaris]|uniref:UvrD-helicase domain-containing protein n=1 Tax=Rossellomorea aquimaris TaxID=189382 RepID=UPI001CD3D8F7|nr:UvrD-helicase domain-containing protein [Rossellomorea aquimaris]MCA1053646.1 UvrD-helicase domain-containing protein [Rossellomorea aquimaris]
MRVLALEKFYKSVPKDKEIQVNERVMALLSELKDNNHNFKLVSKGYGSKKVESLKEVIYKFTVGRSDRILYTYGSKLPFIGENYHDSIVLLEYCEHDSQIRTAKGRNFRKQKVREYTDKSNSVEDKVKEDIKSLSIEDSIVKIFNVDQLTDVFGEEGYFYHLNEEQQQIVKLKEKGEFVFGSAGSGKTTIGVYKLVEFLQTVKNSDVKICYFTFSKNLKDRTERLFEKLALELYGLAREEFKNKVDFFTVEEYLEKMSGNSAKIITYEKFSEWYNEYSPVQNFEASSLWKERRGILQGMIGTNWQYELNLPTVDFDEELLEELQNQKYIKLDNKKKSFQLDKELNAVCEYLSKHKEQSQSFRQQVINQYNQVISKNRMLSDQEYIKLNEHYSLFSKEDREKVAKHFKKFDRYVQQLRKENFIEEGELVRNLLPGSKPQYDYMIIDEVQDLTELQVYFLCQLLISKKNVYVCGDFNQTINPTFFKIGRIQSIFGFLGGLTSFEQKILTNNYRSSKNIVEFANAVAELRGNSFTSKLDYEYTEDAVRSNTKKPYLYIGEQEDLFSYIKDKSYVSIVVGSAMAKKELKKKYPKLASSILTVSEIKGIEKKYIITYNILSDYKQQWDEIFEKVKGNKKLNSEMYRFYFNILYVGITRARDVLGMIEDNISDSVINWLMDKVDVVSKFDINQLSLQKESSYDEFFANARELEDDNLYTNAIEAYRDLLIKEDESLRTLAEKGIKRCEIKMEFLSNKDYNLCGERLLKLNEYDEAISYLKLGTDAKALLTAILMSNEYERYNIYEEMMRLKTNPLKVLLAIKNEDLTKRYINNEIKPFSHSMKEVVHKSTKAKNLLVALNS